MQKPLVSKQWRLQAAQIQNPSGQWLGFDTMVCFWIIDGMPGATLSSRHEFLKSELTVVSGVWHLSRSIHSYESLQFVHYRAVCLCGQCFEPTSWAVDHKKLQSHKVFWLRTQFKCLCVFHLSRCQVAIRNTTSMAVLTWLTSWRGTLLILLAGNVSGHHPSWIVWSGTMDPTTLMSRILQMSAV